MRIIEDRDRYDGLQTEVLNELTKAVRGHISLVLSGRVPADLNSVTADIVFSVASIIDGASEIEHRGQSVIPVLAFASSDERNELVFPESGCGSWMHEYAHGASEL
jgi:hypothetical protein